MRIPEDANIPVHEMNKLERFWKDAAFQIGLDTGVFVVVEIEYGKITGSGIFMEPTYKRIFFKVAGHEFDNLTDLKRAIANKAFL